MALHDLVSSKVEHYGGIDLKKNYKKFFSNGLAISIGLHLLLLLFYWTYNMLTTEDEKKIPRIRIKSIADLAPPPSTSEKPQEAVPAGAPPPPAADIAKPTFGVVAPVPDFKAPQIYMPDQAQAPQGPVGDNNGGPVGLPGGDPNAQGKVEIPPQKVEEEADPGMEDFVSVEQDPVPVQNIQSLVQYPEIAKRAGIQGKVTVSALISKTGSVEKVEVIKSDNDLLNNAAIDAMKKAKFTPARQNGQPVKVWFTQPITFRIQ